MWVTYSEIEQLLKVLVERDATTDFDEAKQTLVFKNEKNEGCLLRLPPILSPIEAGDAAHILTQIQRQNRNYTIVLIQAGASALGYFEGGEVVRHKVIKKYMVRAKQGKSQLSYLKSKGKSRVGSRIRLKNSLSFFEEINQHLIEWNVTDKSETLLLALPVNLKSFFYNSDVPPPFDKRDSRIKKVPIDVRIPNFKELMHVNWVVSRGRSELLEIETAGQ